MLTWDDILPIAPHESTSGAGRRRFAWSLAVAALLVVVTVTVYRIGFAVNDDVTMIAFVRGDFGGDATARMLFVNVTLGGALELLYAVASTVPWYPLMLLAAQAVAWAVVLHLAWSAPDAPTGAQRLTVFGVMAAGIPALALELTFTSTAILVAAAGAIAIVRLPPSATFARRAGVAALPALGFAIRERALTAVVVAFAPLFIWFVVRRTRTALTVGLVAAAMVGLLATANFAAFRADEGWREFKSFDSVRSRISNSPRLQRPATFEDALDGAGWSANDLALFRRMLYADPETFTRTALERIEDGTSIRRADRSARVLWQVTTPEWRSPLGIATCCALAVAVARARRRLARLAFVAVSVAWFGGVLVALALYARLPERVSEPLWIGGALVLALVTGPAAPAAPPPASRRSRAGVAVVATVTILVTALTLSAAAQTSRSNERRQADLADGLAHLDDADRAATWVVRAGLHVSGADPMSSSTPFARHRILTLGWSTFSPPYDDRLEMLGVTSPPIRAIVDGDVYVLLTAADRKRIARWAVEHLGREITWEHPPGTAGTAVADFAWVAVSTSDP